jgi:hypothetical protein
LQASGVVVGGPCDVHACVLEVGWVDIVSPDLALEEDLGADMAGSGELNLTVDLVQPGQELR